MKKNIQKIEKAVRLLRKVEELALTEFPVGGQAFVGHPEDPSILAEYYFWDVPGEALSRKIKELLVNQKFELNSNVLTIFE